MSILDNTVLHTDVSKYFEKPPEPKKNGSNTLMLTLGLLTLIASVGAIIAGAFLVGSPTTSSLAIKLFIPGGVGIGVGILGVFITNKSPPPYTPPVVQTVQVGSPQKRLNKGQIHLAFQTMFDLFREGKTLSCRNLTIYADEETQLLHDIPALHLLCPQKLILDGAKIVQKPAQDPLDNALCQRGWSCKNNSANVIQTPVSSVDEAIAQTVSEKTVYILSTGT
ncbi:MAG: hypothetical protein S4CHLAM45_08700 [Chlamydiales bacterium]|nr:hypothetical protein [Chlamydiales bacterium]MCH9620380.1 hypothetical protein [Chlamydiales bacterium]MCH9622974.1 hypothetical protein [Chlamydiales bacterium]